MGKQIMMGAAIAAGLLLVTPAVTVAAPQPQYTVDDVAKSLAGPPSPAAPDNSAAPQAAAGSKDSCEAKGKTTGPDGLCYPSNVATAGFNLGRRANAPTTTASTGPRPARAQAQQVAKTRLQKDLLITFKLGSAELTDQGRVNAQVFAQALKSVPQLADSKFQLAGYTDASGRSDRNMELSQQRAEAVRAFLIQQGVDGGRLTTRGYGAQDFLPGVPANSPENRRVVAVKE